MNRRHSLRFLRSGPNYNPHHGCHPVENPLPSNSFAHTSFMIAMHPTFEHRQAAGGQQRSVRIQTSGSGYQIPENTFRVVDFCCFTVFKLPLELFLEILSYFSDHRQFIRENFYGRELGAEIKKEHAERLTVIRRLTMTCWPLRNLLLPFLWAHSEGCISPTYRHYTETRTRSLGHNLYVQCVYLISNPAIAAYVQSVLSLLLIVCDSRTPTLQDLFR